MADIIGPFADLLGPTDDLNNNGKNDDSKTVTRLKHSDLEKNIMDEDKIHIIIIINNTFN